MNWNQWHQWANQQTRRTSWSRVEDALKPGDVPGPPEEQALDDLIRAFAVKPTRWPSMTARQRAMLYFRFANASSLLGILSLSRLPAPEFNAATIEWLLLTSWHLHGWHQWLDYGEARRKGLQKPPASAIWQQN